MSMEDVLTALLGNPGEQRDKAEGVLHRAFEQNPEAAAQQLFTLARTHANKSYRQFACILFRRKVLNFTNDTVWETLRPDLQSELATNWVAFFKEESENIVLKQVAENIQKIMLCEKVLNHSLEDYGQLVEMCLKFAKEQGPRSLQSVHLLDLIAGNHYELIAPFLQDAIKLTVNVFSNANCPLNKRLKSLDLFTSMTIRLDEYQAALKMFDPAIEQIYVFLEHALNNMDMASSDRILSKMVEIACNQPRFYVRQVDRLKQAMDMITKSKNVDDEVRQKSLELLIKICESCPAMVSNNSDFIKTILLLCFTLMIEMDDLSIQEWNEEALTIGVDQERNPEVGESTIDRLTAALGIQRVIPVIRTVVFPMFKRQEWPCRHAALMTLTQIVEYLSWEDVQQICEQIIAFFNDAHPRVRWACINCVGQICTDHGPHFQKQFGESVLDGFMCLMNDRENSRVQAHAAAALINFAEPCEAVVLQNHLQKLLEALKSLLENGSRNVQEQAVTAIAGLAENSKRGFTAYYDSFVPILFKVIQNATSEEYGDLRGRAFEALTFIGIAVGHDTFLQDGIKLMRYSIPLMKSLNPTDAVYPFVIHSWARVADALQQDFNPFVQAVMEIVQPYVDNVVTVTVQDNEAERHDLELLYEDDGVKLYLDYSLVDLKKHSIHLLAIIANFCEPQHLQILAESFTKAAEFSWDPHVNQCAVLSLISVVNSAKRAWGPLDERTLTVFRNSFSKVHERLRDTEDAESGVILVNCLKNFVRKEQDLLRLLGQTDAASMPTMISNLITAVELWGHHFETTEVRMDNENYDDYSKEYIREDLEYFDSITKEISLVAGEILALFGDSCAQMVNELVQHKFDDLWNKDQLLYKRTVVYFISDFFENIAPAHLIEVFDKLCAALFTAIEMDDPSITQAAFNALGVIGSNGSDMYQKVIPKICEKLLTRLQTFPRDLKHRCSRDNCIAAIIKTSHRHSLQQPIMDAFQHLPLLADRAEAKVCHLIFAQHLQQSQELFLGPDPAKLLWVVNLFIQLFQQRAHLCDNDTASFISSFLKEAAKHHEEVLSQKLSPERIEALKRIVTSVNI